MSISILQTRREPTTISRVSTNGSSGHHHRHGGSTSGLGGYSPRKRKSEAAVKTPSPSKHSVEKKRAGLDLPPAGTNNPSAVVSSSFLVSNCAVLSNNHDVILTSSLDLALAKPLPVSFLSDLSTGKNTNIDSVLLEGFILRIYLLLLLRKLSWIISGAVTINDVVIDSPHKIFIGGISNHLSSEMLVEIAGSFGSLKAYHFETKVSNGSCAFLEPSVKYVDHSVTIKACAGLNGMKLGGEVLTVLQAMPDASPSENAGEPPSYGIPEHAEPLLRKPTQVLEINNVFADSIWSLSDVTIEEILDDVRLECARFGTIKSINVVKHSSDENLATKLEECEVINKVDAKDVSQDTNCITNNTEYSFSDKANYSKFKGTNGMEIHDNKEMEEDKVDEGSSVNVDKSAEVFDDKSCREHLVDDTAVEDAEDKNIPCSIIQECLGQQDTLDDGPEFLDMMEGFAEWDTSAELVGPQKSIDTEDDIYGHVFTPGSVLVEYGRAEACCSEAHCLHGRFFDGRMVTVEYVALSLYRTRFTT
ncbi:hypothetical protein JHK85_002964 [Glycine max]|nr:hypothetical protein JHK85_002964 [Glycine max]